MRIKTMIANESYPRTIRNLVQTMKELFTKECARGFAKPRVYEERLKTYEDRKKLVLEFDSQSLSLKA